MATHASSVAAPQALLVIDRSPENGGRVELFQFRAMLLHAHCPVPGQGDLEASVVGIDVEAVLRMPHVAVLAADHDHAQIGRIPRLRSGRRVDAPCIRITAAADAKVLLLGLFVAGARSNGVTDFSTLLIAVAAVIGQPGKELRAQKVAVAVMEDGCRGAVLELEEGRLIAGNTSLLEPVPIAESRVTLRSRPPPSRRTTSI